MDVRMNQISPYVWPGMPESAPVPTDTEQITKVVCEHYKVNPLLLGQPIRWPTVIRARFVAWHLMRDMIPHIRLVDMGRMFNKDHTTVMHGLRSISNDIDTSAALRKEVEQIRRKVKYKA